jgi:hypothetical protein
MPTLDSGTVNSTPLSLQGLVSLAAGGKVWVACEEVGVQENDDVGPINIVATTLSGFQIK